MRHLKLLAILLFSSAASAQSEIDSACLLDTKGVTTSTFPGMPNLLLCSNCRNIVDFPEDFQNRVFNYFAHEDQGTAIREIYLESVPNVSSAIIDIPVCNSHGQCGTGRFGVVWKMVGFSLFGARLAVPYQKEGYIAGIRQTTGDVTTQIWDPDTGRLKIPSSTQDDSIPDGDCRNNLGQTASYAPPDDFGGGGAGEVPSETEGTSGAGGSTPGSSGPQCRWYEDGNETVVVCKQS